MPVSEHVKARIFDEVIVEHSGAILHFLLSKCHDPQIAEDLAQVMWAYVYRKFSVDDMRQKGLLYHKANQVWIDHYRKHAQRRPSLHFTDELPEPTLMPERREPSSPEEDKVLFDQFWELFYPEEFEERSRMIFWLHERYGYTMKEVAERLSMSKSTAHDLLKRLKQQCLEFLENS